MTIFDPIIGILQSGLQGRRLRQSVISSNIANADTPGFQAQGVEFESELKARIGAKSSANAVAQTEHGHMNGGGQTGSNSAGNVTARETTGNVGPDGNNVSRDEEMSRMAENQILYRATAKSVTTKLALLRYAISESGR